MEYQTAYNLRIQPKHELCKFPESAYSESEAVKNNDIAIVAINHIRRESEYFIGIVTAAMRNH